VGTVPTAVGGCEARSALCRKAIHLVVLRTSNREPLTQVTAEQVSAQPHLQRCAGSGRFKCRALPTQGNLTLSTNAN
jgi:hypothetical protein